MYDTTPTNHYERKLLCNTVQCATNRVRNPVYVNYLVDIGTPSHCPTCAQTTVACGYDYADILVTKYQHPKLTRKLAICMLNLLSDRNLSRSQSNQQSIEDVMTELGFDKLTDRLTNRYKTYITSRCATCGGSFTLLASGHIPVQQTPAIYCIWCGANTCNETQEDTEETAMISLASHYNLPLPIFRFLYNEWHTDSKYQYLYDYITNDPQVQQIIQKLNSKQTA